MCAKVWLCKLSKNLFKKVPPIYMQEEEHSVCQALALPPGRSCSSDPFCERYAGYVACSPDI